MSSDGETHDTIAVPDLDQPRETQPFMVGYTAGELLGRGGMGEVVLAHDQRVGRNVAIKRMRSKAPSEMAVTRFLREARIQARLEHPAIVPVYELGEASDGTPYFTMKRLAGVTLSELIGDEVRAEQALDLKGKLRALVDACLAIEFAHSHGVVHRDLKPSNIMLGDFGEVYVLDWGIARVLDGGETKVAAADIQSLDGETEVGALLGTPGFMAPEQVQGPDVGPAADVYALGAILFEILCDEPLHPRGGEAFISTLTTPTCSPRTRRPERSIAPELDAACVAALAVELDARPSARELARRIQNYLDGDRDVERRRALAAEGVELARDALASGDPSRRAEAMAAAGRALALDPESNAAAAIVGRLMLETPDKLPGELTTQLHETDVELDVRAANTTIYAMLMFLLFAPLLAWIGVTSWPMIGAMMALVVALAGLCILMVRMRRPMLTVFMLGFALLMVLMSQLFSPFILIPGMLGVSSASLIGQPGFVKRPLIPIGVALVAWLVPFALEALGLFTSTWSFTANGLAIRSGVLELDGGMVTVLLVLGNVALIGVNGFYAHALASTRHEASQKLEIHAWHLRKLLPATRGI